jgi:hypothetical protein
VAEGFTTDALRSIGQELRSMERKQASAVRKAIRAAVTEAGTDVANAVKASASSQGLNKAAGAVYVRPNFSNRSAGVRVVVNRRKAPYARPMEMGNREGGNGRSWFWHPVFGRKTRLGTRVTTKQPKRPFFFKAIDRSTPDLDRKFFDAITKAYESVMGK